MSINLFLSASFIDISQPITISIDLSMYNKPMKGVRRSMATIVESWLSES